MAIDLEYPTVNEDGSSSARQTATVIRNTVDGKMNARGEGSLSGSGTTTVITDSRITAESWLGLMPLSSASANVGAYWWSNQTDGQVTLNHASNASGTFRLLIIG